MVIAAYWRATVVKYWLAPGGPFWVNTYELQAPNPSDINDLPQEALAAALWNFERFLHSTQVYFDRVVFSSLQEDSRPYDPTAGSTFPLGGYGLRNATDRVDLNAVLKVRRAVSYGRTGKLAFRGVLQEGDITASAQGFWDLDPTSGLQPTGDLWVSAKENIDGLFNGSLTGAEDWKFIMSPNPGDNENPLNVPRNVINFIPQGAGFSRFNHRYFDRG